MDEHKLKNIPEPELFRDIFSYEKVPAINLGGELVKPSLPEEFWITDTTFRDGQQARPPYTVDQIVKIFTLMHRVGGERGLIRQTEFFLYSKRDREAVEACRELGFEYPQITAWIRAVKKDFELVKSMGLNEAGILSSCSDYHIFLKLKKTRREALDGYKDVVATAMENNVIARCHLEDITRADIYGFVIPMINELTEMSKESEVRIKFRLCDTMGYGLPYAGSELPRSVPGLISTILRETDLESEQLEWHGHNDFHKVLANAATAWIHGCCAANGTFLGFGERTGNPPIEALVFEWMGLTGIHDGINPTALTDAAEYFSKEIGYHIPSNFPFVGSDFNTTRAGIHADGLTKNEEIYNIFNTEKWLKRPCKVAVTNNSGLAGIAYWIHGNLGDKASDIRKDHPGLAAVKEWIDLEYRNGRVTSISDEEMRREVKKALPELFQ